jgi:hypothetical protein
MKALRLRNPAIVIEKLQIDLPPNGDALAAASGASGGIFARVSFKLWSKRRDHGIQSGHLVGDIRERRRERVRKSHQGLKRIDVALET